MLACAITERQFGYEVAIPSRSSYLLSNGVFVGTFLDLCLDNARSPTGRRALFGPERGICVRNLVFKCVSVCGYTRMRESMLCQERVSFVQVSVFLFSAEYN